MSNVKTFETTRASLAAYGNAELAEPVEWVDRWSNRNFRGDRVSWEARRDVRGEVYARLTIHGHRVLKSGELGTQRANVPLEHVSDLPVGLVEEIERKAQDAYAEAIRAEFESLLPGSVSA